MAQLDASRLEGPVGFSTPTTYPTAQIYDTNGNIQTVYTSGPNAGRTAEGTLVMQGEAPTPTPTPTPTPKTTTTAASAYGNAYLGEDGFYYQPMSDGTTVKLGKGASQTPSNSSALDDIVSIMKQVGLTQLATDAYTQWKSGVPVSKIMDDIQSSQVYKDRFPGMASLAAAGKRITESAYIAKEQADIDMMKAYGVDTSVFGTTAQLGKLISNNVNTADLQQRLADVRDVVLSQDKNTLQYAKDTYGLDAGDITSYILNPELMFPVIQAKTKAFQMGGAALQAGFKGLGDAGQLSQAQAEDLVSQGVTQQQAQQGFVTAANLQPLGAVLPGSSATDMSTVSNQDLINAAMGTDALAQQKLKKAQQIRTSEFQQGGGFAATQAGVKGIGAGPSV